MKGKKVHGRQQEKGLYQGGWILLLVFLILAVGRQIFHIRFLTLPCLIHKWTGYYCPGCGGTRAFLELLKGHFITSFFYHPVVLYGGVLYACFMVSHTIEYLSKGKFKIGIPYTDWYLYIAIAIILLQWVVKNVVKAVWGIGLA